MTSAKSSTSTLEPSPSQKPENFSDFEMLSPSEQESLRQWAKEISELAHKEFSKLPRLVPDAT